MLSKKTKKIINKLTPDVIKYAYKDWHFKKTSAAIKKRAHSRIMIIGCGRSGTTFTSSLFEKNGYHLGHEMIAKNGISSWYLVSNMDKVPRGPSFNELKSFDIPAVHQVRSPLKAISSMLTTGWPSYKFISNEVPIDFDKDSKILKSMKYWYYWNQMAEKKASFTYQVESIDKHLDDILELGKFSKENFEVASVSTKVNSRKHDILTWEDLLKEDQDLSNKIKELARKYKYNL